MNTIKNLLIRARDRWLAAPTFYALESSGNFRVNYHNGDKSRFMDYRSAKNLAEVHGGKVVHRNQVEAEVKPEPKCSACGDSGILGHSNLCECQQAEVKP